MHLCPNCGITLSRFDKRTIGNITITETNEFLYKGTPVKLSADQKMVTQAFLMAAGRTLARDTLLTVLDNDSSTRSVDVIIKRIRRAFEDVDPTFNELVTEYGFGYRWKTGQDLRLAA